MEDGIEDRLEDRFEDGSAGQSAVLCIAQASQPFRRGGGAAATTRLGSTVGTSVGYSIAPTGKRVVSWPVTICRPALARISIDGVAYPW